MSEEKVVAICANCGLQHPIAEGYYCTSCESFKPATKKDIWRLERKIDALIEHERGDKR